MPNHSKVIAFDVDEASLISLRKALPDSVIDVVNGATAGSLTRDWNPGTVDLTVAFRTHNEIPDLGGRDRIHFLIVCR